MVRKYISIVKNAKTKTKVLVASVLVITMSLFGVYLFNSLGNDKMDDVTINETIKLSDIDLNKEEGIYTANLSVSEEQYINYIKINILNENKETMVTLIGYVGRNVKIGDSIKISAATDEDISKYDSITYEKVDSNE